MASVANNLMVPINIGLKSNSAEFVPGSSRFMKVETQTLPASTPVKSWLNAVDVGTAVAQQQLKDFPQQVKPKNPLLETHHNENQLAERRKEQVVSSSNAMDLLNAPRNPRIKTERPSPKKDIPISNEVQKPKWNVIASSKAKEEQNISIQAPIEKENKVVSEKTFPKKSIQAPVEKEDSGKVLTKKSLATILSSENKQQSEFATKIISAPKAPTKSLKEFKFVHENGIFASYALSDLHSIAKLVLEGTPQSCLSYDCFNYETTRELELKKDVAKEFKTNKEAVNLLQTENKLNFTLHYEDKHNDLFQERELKPADCNWSKFDRRFTKNMIFFNPYYCDKASTTHLVKSFFEYAATNLDDSGVVTVMWNPKREDMMKGIDIPNIASKNSFKLVKACSGKEFADKTGFTHLKNNESLQKGTNATITAKPSDTLMLFQKTWQKEIPEDNLVAKAFTKFSQVKI